MCRPKRDGRDVLAFFDDRGHKRGAQELADPFDADRSDAGDLTRLAGEGEPAEQGFVVDHDVGGPAATLGLLGVAGHGFGERVGGVGVLGLVGPTAAGGAEVLPGFLVDHGFDRAPDLGGDFEVAFDHPVGGGPHPKRPGRVLPLRPRGLVFAAGPHGDDLVAQRHVAVSRRPDQLPLHRRILRSRGHDQTCRAGRQRPGPHRRIRLGQRLELPCGLYRALRLAGSDADQPLAELRRVPVVLIGVRGRLFYPPRRPAEYSVGQPPDPAELLDQINRVLPTARARIEPACRRFESSPCDSKIILDHVPMISEGWDNYVNRAQESDAARRPPALRAGPCA
jgi:hypothetical protein